MRSELHLRHATVQDTPYLLALERDPEIRSFGLEDEIPSEEDMIRFVQENQTLKSHQQERWMIQGSNGVIGTLDFFDFEVRSGKVSLGIALYPKSERYSGKGSQALGIGLDWFFTFGENVMVEVQKWNPISKHFFQKNGFQKKGKTNDEIEQLAISKSEWQTKRSQERKAKDSFPN